MSADTSIGSRPFRLFIVAGEPSGDVLGERLIRALRSALPHGLALAGVGGPRMRAAGLAPLFPMEDIAVMGMAEILPRLPTILDRMKAAKAAVVAHRPDVLVTIDSAGFNLAVAKHARAAGIRCVHYVAPAVWAWRPGRARKFARAVDHLMTLLPFEPAHFAPVGLAATFVGHPVIEGGAAEGDAARFRAMHGIADDARILTVLPGSRRGEVGRLLPVFAETMDRLEQSHPGLVVALPTVSNVADLVGAAAARWPQRTLVLQGDPAKYDAFAASAVALACSGTVSLELALARTPTVITYKVTALSAFLARRLMRIRFANLVNIMHDRSVVPELLQEDCRADRLAAEIATLLDDPAARAAQIAGLGDVAGWLGAGGPAPSLRAARLVLQQAGWPEDRSPG